MFKKKPNIKPLSPLRSSDRRKTADQIISDLQIETPSGHDDTPEGKATVTAALATLRNSLLPDSSLSARFTTTAGPELKQVSGTVYVGSHAGEEQRILWVKIAERMYPTVYTLWRNPGIVPLIHTPSLVIGKLKGGADLMTPGLAGGPPFPEKAKKDAIVAVASTESPTVPVAVGRCEIDVSALQQVQGAKGHAVENMHWAGDELWSWSASGKPGVPAPEEIAGWGAQDDATGISEQVSDLRVGEDAEGGVSLDAGLSDDVAQERSASGKQPSRPEEELAEVVDVQLSTKEIDDAFRKAFLYGVRHHMDVNRGQHNYGLQFPLNQSLVMSTLVQPFLPAHTASHAQQLQIKKTSWKNIKKFIKSLDKEKIIKSKDRDGNEVVIVDIDFGDRNIESFVPYRLPKKDTAAGTGQGRGDAAAVSGSASGDSADPAIGQKLKRIELFRLREKHTPLLPSTSSPDPRALYTAAELRPFVTAYIDAEQLAPATNRRLVALDPFLANAVYDGTAPSDKEALARGSVPRDALLERVLAGCARFHAIVREPAAPSASTSAAAAAADVASKAKSGPPPKLIITLETRGGNKTVTRVSGLEPYHLHAGPLAEELRRACAGSASVEQARGSSPKTPAMEVTVQGPQRDAVLRALERRGVAKGWVEVVDRTKGKKRG